MLELFRNRVEEARIAAILALIAERPNRRERPGPGDPAGDFNYWFDGGAARVLTGAVEYVLSDGTRVRVAAPIPSLALTIVLADGRSVRVEQLR
jgi:hypothetical protein